MAQVPYLIGNGSLNTFVSYDDPQSIGLKANYIKNKNLRGAIIWEITGDYIETAPGSGIIAATPLVDTLKSVFCNGLPTPLLVIVQQVFLQLLLQMPSHSTGTIPRHPATRFNSKNKTIPPGQP
ncbi:MAG: hypothetical protein HWD58_10905 [Bacteroidota bacterium]|nr:MAG: hypothetical protein HWD58_10905 [Bacteroidota bacterium]